MNRINFIFRILTTKCLVLFLVLLFVANCLIAQRIDSLMVYSPSMKREIKTMVVLPAGYGEQVDKKYPVIFLLHGFGDACDGWLKRTKPDLPQCASAMGCVFVCPDGERSWYWDSPQNPKIRFETFVSSELIKYIDGHYKTVADRKGRAITGLSMGGHGAFWLAFRHPDVFGACGSMSGGVDIRPFPGSWSMSEQLGKLTEHPDVWDAHTVINQVDRIQPGQLAIIFDCGTEDFFYKVNENLHAKLLLNHIPHDYITRPGGHNHTYWNNALDYQLLFFDKYFRK